MLFEQFAEAHGLMLRSVEYGRWARVPTTDHPNSKNGAYKHLGDVAFVQNHATMAEPETWFPESAHDIKIDVEAIRRRKAKADKELAENRVKAAKKAEWILGQTSLEKHAYLHAKGFPDMLGMVWQKSESDPILCIPMRVGSNLVGVQLIDYEGNKKFLYGQRTSGAEFLIDNKGSGALDWYCEGAATGYSLREVLSAIKVHYRIHICFSAHNLTTMASRAEHGVVVADNDASETGQKAAIASGKPYLMPPVVGNDFNDWQRSIGTFQLSQIVRKWIRETRGPP